MRRDPRRSDTVGGSGETADLAGVGVDVAASAITVVTVVPVGVAATMTGVGGTGDAGVIVTKTSAGIGVGGGAGWKVNRPPVNISSPNRAAMIPVVRVSGVFRTIERKRSMNGVHQERGDGPVPEPEPP